MTADQSQLAHFRDLPARTRVAAAFAVLSAHGPVTQKMVLDGAKLDPQGSASDERRALEALIHEGAVEQVESGGWRITGPAQTAIVTEAEVDIAEATTIVEGRVGVGG